MSRYISLNPHTQLEQAIAYDLNATFGERGLFVIHNGTKNSHAPGGKPDIVVRNEKYVLIIEVTKTKGSGQDREFHSIRSHLKSIKVENPELPCFCIFLSPKTSSRTLESIHDHNRQRAGEGKTDMKILPLSFEFFELWIDRLLENPKRKYSIDDLISIFDLQEDYKNDLEIGRVFYRIIFKEDLEESELFERQLHRKRITVHLGSTQVSARKRRVATHRPSIGLDFWMEYFLFYSTRGWNRFSRTTGISLVQFEILNQINTRETWSISEISHHLEITVPAASQLVDKLVQSGLVYRSENKRDRRARQLTISPNGAHLVEKGRRERHLWLDELAESLSAEEKRKVSEALNILTKAAQKMDEEK